MTVEFWLLPRDLIHGDYLVGPFDTEEEADYHRWSVLGGLRYKITRIEMEDE